MYRFLNVAGNKECSPDVQDPERELTYVMLSTVVTLLQGSVRNAGNASSNLALSSATEHGLWWQSRDSQCQHGG